MATTSRNLIGAGTYGCIYRPPIPCQDADLTAKYANDKYVMKYASRSSLAIEEKYLKTLRPYDPNGEYFVFPITDKCVPQYTHEAITTQLNCTAQKDLNAAEMGTVILPYAGLPLDKYFAGGMLTVSSLLQITKHLLTALSILAKLKIVHADIRADNIVVDDLGVPRIIDFGVASYITSTQISLELYDKHFSRYPPFLAVLWRYHRSPQEKCGQAHYTLEQFLEIYGSDTQVKDAVTEYYNLYGQYKDKYEKEVLKVIDYIDPYMLGITLSQYFVALNAADIATHQQEYEQLRILLTMIRFPLRKSQWNAETAIKYFAPQAPKGSGGEQKAPAWTIAETDILQRSGEALSLLGSQLQQLRVSRSDIPTLIQRVEHIKQSLGALG